MAKFPTYKEMAKEVAEKALDEYIYKGKTLREWINILVHTQWISVTERLPEVMDGTNGECSDDVLIYVIDIEDGVFTISTGFYGYYPNDVSGQGWWSVWIDGCSQLESKYKVIAWRELPEQYAPDIHVGNKTESEV